MRWATVRDVCGRRANGVGFGCPLSPQSEMIPELLCDLSEEPHHASTSGCTPPQGARVPAGGRNIEVVTVSGDLTGLLCHLDGGKYPPALSSAAAIA